MARKRKPWSKLSASSRRRWEKAGIGSAKAYNANKLTLKAALEREQKAARAEEKKWRTERVIRKRRKKRKREGTPVGKPQITPDARLRKAHGRAKERAPAQDALKPVRLTKERKTEESAVLAIIEKRYGKSTSYSEKRVKRRVRRYTDERLAKIRKAARMKNWDYLDYGDEEDDPILYR